MNSQSLVNNSEDGRDLFSFLRSPRYDLTFILGVAFIALLSGYLVVSNPRLFPLILFIDLWLLGYHHVISTFTRISFSFIDIRENKWLIASLFLVVIPLSFLVAEFFGVWVIATLYLYWQWFHYTRQSYGIARAYWHKGNNGVALNQRVEELAIYLLPLLGIMYRSYQSPEKFLFMDLKTLPVELWMIQVLSALVIVSIVVQLYSWLQAWRSNSLSLAYVIYVLSHHLIFFVGYLLIPDINYGWLVLNVWHNAQYILFVWLQNNRSFHEEIDHDRVFLSYFSQKSKILIYMVVCLLISTVLYKILELTLGSSDYSALVPVTLVVYSAINFHHYIIDGIIWTKKA